MPDTLVLLLAVAYPVAVLVLVRRVRWPGRGSSQGSWFGGRWERRWVRGVDCACVLLIGFSSAYRANSGGCPALSANLPQLPNKPLPILASRAPNGRSHHATPNPSAVGSSRDGCTVPTTGRHRALAEPPPAFQAARRAT